MNPSWFYKYQLNYKYIQLNFAYQLFDITDLKGLAGKV